MAGKDTQQPPGCNRCREAEALDFDFTMAFQPILDIRSGAAFGHEALARGPNNEPAGTVFERVHDGNRYSFDQTCRVKAIELAGRLGLNSVLSINFMPNAVYQPELCIRTSIAAAQRHGLPFDRLMFEITEAEKVADHAHLKHIVEHYQELGFKTALDDFGAGYSGLNLLADFQPDFVKLDMKLVRGIDADRNRQAIVRAVLQAIDELGVIPIAEGIETRAECATLAELGVALFQGYYFARPAFRALAPIAPEALAAAREIAAETVA